MRIEDIINLIDGDLTNKPHIDSINKSTLFLNRVETGDLFFSSNKEEIKEAVENGAYAIVYDNKEIEIIDKDIAWIEVKSIYEASFKYLRYLMLETKFYNLSKIEITLLKMIINYKKQVVFLSNEWEKAFEQILNSKNVIFIGNNQPFLEIVTSKAIKLNKDVDGYSIFDTLFKTTFKVNGYVYQEKEIAPIHLEALLRVIDFCNINELEFDLEKLKYTKHFTPVFIDRNLQATSSNKSTKVTIFTDNIEDILKAKEYIKSSNKWVKSIILTPPNTKIPTIDRPQWYESSNELRDFLKKLHYNYAFILNSDKEVLNEMQNSKALF